MIRDEKGYASMELTNITQYLTATAAQIGLKALGALALWIIGSWLISFAVRITERAMINSKVDPTIIRYVGSGLSITLKVLLCIGILGFFGIQTTTFAALLAALGLAIGTAWGGLLANFAAGAFLVVLRPFKVGDQITAGGVTGKVEEIGLFVTTINTLENVRTFIGNNRIFSDNIHNYTANPYRRVDCIARLDLRFDYDTTISMIKERVSKVPNVLSEPEPVIGIDRFTALGPLLAVRPYCHNEHYPQVYLDTNHAINEALVEIDGYQSGRPQR